MSISSNGHKKCIDCDDESSFWKKGSTAFEDMFSIAAGESRLVLNYIEQIRLFTNSKNREKAAITESILYRLLDYQYLFGKTHSCN